MTQRVIARAVHIGLGSVNAYLRRAEEVALDLSEVADLDETALRQRLYPKQPAVSDGRFAVPDFAIMHAELKRKGVTRQGLYEDYLQAHPDQALSYSQYCHRYQQWRKTLKRSMRQIHKAGEKLFVDYAGQTVPVVDPRTGELRQAEIFVASLGASNYTFAEATWSQKLADFVGSHQRAFAFFGGVPEIVVPDQLRSAVSRPCRYDPDLNPTYHQMIRHYGAVAIPARPRKPKDKAKAENAVLVVERWILARLRHQTFFSLAELNAAIKELLEDLNQRPFKQLPGSRASAFAQLDRPALTPLPTVAYEFTEVKKARVHVDYHVAFENHFYSVPHALVKRQIEVHATAQLVRIVHRGQSVAAHPRSFRPGFTTRQEHMPEAHRRHRFWNPHKLAQWARKLGPHVGQFTDTLLHQRDHPEQAYRAWLGLQELSRSYGAERLDAACRRAIELKNYRHKTVRNILKNGLDKPVDPPTSANHPDHENIRGQAYYR